MKPIIIEEWLHGKIRQAASEITEFKCLLGKGGLEKINRTEVEKYHLFNLRKSLAYAYDRSRFYKDIFDKKRIKPDDLNSLDDFSKIPLTEPTDLAENPYKFLCISQKDVTRAITFTSSGTTGPQKRIFYTERDIESMVDFMRVGIGTVANSGDIVQILLPGGAPFGQLDLLSKAVERLGASPIKAGTNLSSIEQIELIKKHKSNILFVSTPNIYRITQESLVRGYKLNKLGIKTLFLTSGYMPESMRKRLESVWDCEVSFHYGLSEMGLGVAVECQAHNGFHFNEEGLFLEVVDPTTGNAMEEGKHGELVFTTLNRKGMPLIRYRTHDISKLFVEPCPCGAISLLKFDKIDKRLESILKVGHGDEVYPSLFDDALYQIPEIVDYQATLKKVENKDNLILVVEVTKLKDEIKVEIRKRLLELAIIEKNISIGKMTQPEIKLVGLGELKRIGRAKRMILDSRQ